MTNPILQAIFQSTLPTRGSDLRACMMKIAKHYFNPRSPRGGATGRLDRPLIMKDFNPRSPRGGATFHRPPRPSQDDISIHAPHEGERRTEKRGRRGHRKFQSTLPTRGSDVPHNGHDHRSLPNFNPRSPRGGATIFSRRIRQ